jgi:hypothetical protein
MKVMYQKCGDIYITLFFFMGNPFCTTALTKSRLLFEVTKDRFNTKMPDGS